MMGYVLVQIQDGQRRKVLLFGMSFSSYHITGKDLSYTGTDDTVSQKWCAKTDSPPCIPYQFLNCSFYISLGDNSIDPEVFYNQKAYVRKHSDSSHDL